MDSYGRGEGDLVLEIGSLISTILLQHRGFEKDLIFIQNKLSSVKGFLYRRSLYASKTFGNDTMSLLQRVKQALLAAPSTRRQPRRREESKKLLKRALLTLDEVETHILKDLAVDREQKKASAARNTDPSGLYGTAFLTAPYIMRVMDLAPHPIMEFLNSAQHSLHLVGIVGEGGVGKTTLLVNMVRMFCSKQAFSFVASVHLVDDQPKDQALVHAQASMLRQLGGPEREFKSLRDGRVALRKRLEDLTAADQSFCIAIDNVWRAKHLKELLSDVLSPAALSCVVITSRICCLVDDLEDLCARRVPSIPFQAMVYEQKPLQFGAAKSLLLAQLNITNRDNVPEEQERILGEVCTYFGGVPLVLKAAGGFLAQLNHDDWKVCTRLMERASWISFFDNGVQLMQIFEISYKNLHMRSKEALCDIASFLHEWKWNTVQTIVGDEAMKELTSFHLIRSVDQHLLTSDIVSSESAVVIMHKFIRKLALKKRARNHFKLDMPSWLSLDVHHLKFLEYLHLDVEVVKENIVAPTLPLSGRCFSCMERLRVLDLSGSFECGEMLLPECLVYLKLASNNLARQLSKLQVPCSVQHFELEHYEELLDLPMSIYECKNLQTLRLYGCPVLLGLRYFSNWQCLRRLHLEGCHGITQLPEDLKELELLVLHNCTNVQGLPPLPSKKARVIIQDCPHLSAFTEVVTSSVSVHDAKSSSQSNKADPQGHLRISSGLHDPTTHSCKDLRKLSSTLVHLKFHNCTCRKLEGLGLEEMKSLRKLKLRFCKNVVRLPQGIGRLESLVVLDLRGCLELEQLPPDLGRLSALEKIKLHDCVKLKKVPECISSLVSLTELNLIGCIELEELPEEIGSLRFLRVMRLARCQKLQCLPNSICNLHSLSQLDLHGCENLKEVPKRIGNLGASETFLLMECHSIRILPDSICKLSSLSVLFLNKCRDLEALPEDLGKLSSLTTLGLAECLSLKSLCKSICNLKSLTMLDLQGCSNLEGLPEDFGSNLEGLETLFLMECQKLESLPLSFSRMKSLKDLDLSGCLKLERLPETFGELSSLRKLRLSNCEGLKQLPDSICHLRSLELMDLHGCHMLEKLPMGLGSLSALEELNLVNCAELKALPNSMGNLKSLKELDLRGSGLEELVL